MLKKYDVTAQPVRIGEKVARGYRLDDLHDAFARYLPPAPPRVTAGRRYNRYARYGAALRRLPGPLAVDDGHETHPGCDWTAA